MTDVEKLLRETLADPRHRLEPLPGMYDGVRARARHRQQRMVQLASAVTVVVVIAGVATAVGLNTHSPRKAQPAASLSASPPVHGQFNRVDIGAGSTGFLSVTPSAIFLAQTDPNGLLAVTPSDLSVAKQIVTPDAVQGTAVDAARGLVWTWSSTQPVDATSGESAPGTTSIHAYQTSTLAKTAEASLPSYTFDAVALRGELWLATSDGLYVVDNTNGSPTATKVSAGQVFSVAADDAHHRVLFGVHVDTPTTSSSANSMGSIAVHAIDNNTRAVKTVGTPVPVGKESIAVVDGQVWVAGYGSDSQLTHLDANTLRPIGTGGLELELGPGASVWPGASVLWVRSGGSEALSCVDPKTGAVLQHWDAVQGPVASVIGRAYAASDGSFEQLTLAGGCKG